MTRAAAGDRGASIVMVAISLLLLLSAAAVAIDLALLRLDRSADQKVTDSAASAGALAAQASGGQEACETALAYVVINSEGISSVNNSQCAVFSAACDPSAAISQDFVSDRFTIRITYPVPDNDPLMTSGQLGAPTQPVVSEDGQPCERVGVEMSAVREGLFSQLLGFDQGTTTVHTVAIAEQPEDEGVPLNLLVLERTGCDAMHVTGNGGIVVTAVVNKDRTGLLQGVAASDSDGSDGCTNNGVIDVDGSNSVLRADGPTGCADQIGTGIVDGFTSGQGCGLVQTIAPGAGSGCVAPACTTSGGNPSPIPDPSPMPGRLTRAPVDYRYNCWGDYTSPPPGVDWAVDPLDPPQQDIPGCTGGTPPHIYNLILDVQQNGSKGGFTNWSTLPYGCDLDSSTPPIEITGNVRVDCASLNINSDVTIKGNVIFDGDVDIRADGQLVVDNSAGAGDFAFFRGGELKKAGQGSLKFQDTAVYMSKTSTVNLTGGSGTLIWVAPDSGRFDDLALWSDSSDQHRWAGQANLSMEGVFFMPLAQATYTGGGGQNQTKAQWVARKLEAKGQGSLQIAPEFGRAVLFPVTPRTTLIR